MNTEKWSPWIDWSGGECPLSESTEVQPKLRNGNFDSVSNAGAYRWTHDDWHYDIIAYRYRIQENEMPENLRWLALHLHEWPWCIGKASELLGGLPDKAAYDAATGKIDGISEPQWLQARKDLGLIMTEYEEELPAEEWGEHSSWAGAITDTPEEAAMVEDMVNGKRDMVNAPPHYQLRPGYEVYDLRQDLAAKAANGGATYDQYSDWDRATEYLVRMWGKNKLEDLKKCRWYVDKLIEKLEAE